MSQHAIDLVRSKGKLPARYGNFIGADVDRLMASILPITARSMASASST
jgi:hypothetical protein